MGVGGRRQRRDLPTRRTPNKNHCYQYLCWKEEQQQQQQLLETHEARREERVVGLGCEIGQEVPLRLVSASLSLYKECRSHELPCKITTTSLFEIYLSSKDGRKGLAISRHNLSSFLHSLHICTNWSGRNVTAIIIAKSRNLNNMLIHDFRSFRLRVKKHKWVILHLPTINDWCVIALVVCTTQTTTTYEKYTSKDGRGFIIPLSCTAFPKYVYNWSARMPRPS